MARRLRHHVRGGWYHVTTRGLGRRRIFYNEQDRAHFVELLAGMVSRYGVVLHAYVLLDNHYHLLLETPEGNASRALQWLNVSYSVWHNRLYDEAGAMFQARFKSIPVESQGSWALTCSMYIHLNPVRIKALGLGKRERALEKDGRMPQAPTPEQIQSRLAVLRNHGWSSYPCYAGYAVAPEWLTRQVIWSRVAREGAEASAEYRNHIEDYLKQGMEDGVGARLSQMLAIGSTVFIEKLRKRIPARAGEGTNARAWHRLLSFEEVVQAVVAIKKEPWIEFADRRGDWGRDLALYIGRMHCGLTLQELGAKAGMHVQAVSKAVMRLDARCKTDKALHRVRKIALRKLVGKEQAQ